MKFHEETLEIFKGSLSKVTPLNAFRWIKEPKPIQPQTRIRSDRVEKIRLMKYFTGLFKDSGVLYLAFDVGIRGQIEGVRLSLLNRGKQCGRPAQFGYGGQYSFYHYLNYFMAFSEFRFQHDCVFGSAFNLPYDFRIFFPKHKFSLEVKTSLPKMAYCRYYKTDPNPFPDWVVCVRALDEQMLTYELYGYCTGSDVQKIEPKLIKGSTCYEIPIDRDHFKPYNNFHTKILRLPMLEKFDNNHYIKP